MASDVRLRASTTATVNYSFTCSKDRGALLFLNDNADGLHCIANTLLPTYIAKHYESWCQFATQKYIDIDDPELEGPILVRGFLKTSSWGAAAWLEAGSAHDLTLTSGFGPYLNAGVSFSFLEESSCSTHYRSGPERSSSLRIDSTSMSEDGSEAANLPPARNQCVFLSYYMVKRRALFGPKVIKAAGETSEDPGSDDSPPSPYEIVALPSPMKVCGMPESEPCLMKITHCNTVP